jgi:hypothetical protein
MESPRRRAYAPASTEKVSRERKSMRYRVALLAALSLAWLAGPASAQAPTGKVTVVTSFSKEVTDPFKKAFEKAVPGRPWRCRTATPMPA